MLILHFLFVLGIVIPVPLILIGAKKNWHWIRNPRLRHIHGLMIGIVALESVFGIVCPLTTWEQVLRERAGQFQYSESFIAHWVGRILFYQFEPWVFTLVYIAFGALIVGLYYWVPPHPREPWRVLTCPLVECAKKSLIRPQDPRRYVTCPYCKRGMMANGKDHGKMVRLQRGKLPYRQIESEHD